MAPAHRARGTTPSPSAARGRERTRITGTKRRSAGSMACTMSPGRRRSSRKTRVVSVMDREADFFEVRRAAPFAPHRMLRAKHDRCLGLEAVRNDAQRRALWARRDRDRPCERTAQVQPQEGPPGAQQAPCAGRGPLSQAGCAGHHRAEPAPVSVVHVRETAPPDGEEAVEWFLLTSLDVIIGQTLAVEDFFRVLRMPGRTSRLPHRRAAAARHHHQCRHRLASDVDDPARTRSSTVRRRAHVHRHRAAVPRRLCRQQPLAGAATPRRRGVLVAILGGYQNRKHDPPPGHQIMWRGYERMSIATLGYRLAEKRPGIVQNE